MSELSRRNFLQIAGITLLGSQLMPELLFQQAAAPHLMGRTLAATPVYAAARSDAAIRAYLWPDSLVRILDSQGSWYHVPGGYVSRISLQPMTAMQPHRPWKPDEGEWIEVSAPVAVVRKWCAADAPLVTRIGHGGVARILDDLHINDEPWLGIASDDDALLGWTPMSRWQPLPPRTAAAGLITHLRIDGPLLTAFSGQATLARAPISWNQPLTPGDYSVQRSRPGASVWSEDEGSLFYAAPWQLMFGADHRVSGVYWHNRFGSPAAGPTVQTTPIIARWLYENLCDNGFVTIV